MAHSSIPICLELQDGTRFAGKSFGRLGPASGEVVFTTSMVGYVESLTDPSYCGQILVFTYPLIGNYGVPDPKLPDNFESGRIQVAGIVVTQAHRDQSHHQATGSLHDWLSNEGIPGIEGIDTRHLTLKLREHGTMLGRIVTASESVPLFDPNAIDIVARVSIKEPHLFALPAARKRVVLLDCGVKNSIRRALLARNIEVLQVPSHWDYTGERFDGILLSNGPGNPEQCRAAISVLRRAMALDRPIFGICLGAQLLALASGARTYKLPYGHRGQNQPCQENGTDRCRLTSQNHGYAIAADTLPDDWQVWFTNANDGSVEGIRHQRRPFSAVQFHPEAAPGPLDCTDLFDRFAEQL